MPHASWNKAIARRRLPREALSRGVNSEVPAQGEPPTRTHAAFKVKVWVGFLNRELEDSWTAGGGEEAQYPFRVSGSPGSVAAPLFAGLLQAAQEQFGYETGLSGNGGLGEEEAETVEDRVSAAQRALGAVQQGLERLLERQSEAAPHRQQPCDRPELQRVSPLCRAWTIGALSEARIAGVPEIPLQCPTAAPPPPRLSYGRAALFRSRRRSLPLGRSGGGGGAEARPSRPSRPRKKRIVPGWIWRIS